MAIKHLQLKNFLKALPGTHEGWLLNCFPSRKDPQDCNYEKLISVSTSAPPEPIDYRSTLPPCFDQGQRGSCVACATTWTLKAYEEIVQKKYPNGGLSASYLYSMCKQNDGSPNQEGTQPKVALQVLQNYGICAENLMPYTTLTSLPVPKVPTIPAAAHTDAIKYKIANYAQILAVGDTNRAGKIDIMRQALQQEGPFIIALIVCNNFVPDQEGKLPVPWGIPEGGHAVGIVGDLPDQNAFILRNSWGTNWGLNGYALFPYEWITAKYLGMWAIFEAWTATDLN